MVLNRNVSILKRINKKENVCLILERMDSLFLQFTRSINKCAMYHANVSLLVEYSIQVAVKKFAAWMSSTFQVPIYRLRIYMYIFGLALVSCTTKATLVLNSDFQEIISTISYIKIMGTYLLARISSHEAH